MGVNISVQIGNRHTTLAHRRIEADIERDRRLRYTKIKMLILGTSECGKSTVLKQMQYVTREHQCNRIAEISIAEGRLNTVNS